MKKILLVEDDEFFRAAVKSILASKYEIMEASNGRVAQELIMMSTPDLVISDIQMPHFSGIELLEWIQAKQQQVPVILMTGFSEILETTKAHQMGAKDFIPKPFQSNEMQAKVDRILGEATLKKEENKVKGKDLEREFCKLPIEDFLTERDTEYGVFIRVSENKFIKIAHKGGKIPEDKVQSFKEKGVDYLYVQQEDFVRIVGFTVNLSKMVNESNKVDPAKKLRFIQYTGSMLAQQAYAKGMNEALFHNAKNFLASSMTVILDSPDIFDMLDQLSTHTDYLYAQSLSVSVLSVMMAKQMGIHSPQTLFKVALAGLFHDIGLREISPDILNKSRVRLNQVERALLETHCTRGKEILELMKGMPADVIQVTYEHHEDILGTGYPRRIDKNRIHPLTHIISTADAFIALTMKNPDNPVALESSYALSKLTSTRASLLEPQSLEALTALVVSHK